MKKLFHKLKEIIGKHKRKQYITATVEYDSEWDIYDIRDIQKSIQDLRNVFVDVPFLFSYEDDDTEIE